MRVFRVKRQFQRQGHCAGVFIVNFEHISYLFVVSFVDFEQANISWIKVHLDCTSILVLTRFKQKREIVQERHLSSPDLYGSPVEVFSKRL